MDSWTLVINPTGHKYKPRLKKLKRIVTIAAMLLIEVIICVPSPATGKTKLSSDTCRLIQSFIVADVNGGRMDIILQKNKVIFINFWALTCAPCKAEMPTINNLANHYKNDTNFLVVPVDLDHNFPDDVRYFNQEKFTLKVYTPSGVVPQVLFMGALPTTVVIDKTGKIVLLRQRGRQV